MKVERELLPDHPIEALVATETDRTKGIHNGETLCYLCLECGNADEDVFEIVHEEDCRLAGETAPTGYVDRLEGPLDEDGEKHRLAADGRGE